MWARGISIDDLTAAIKNGTSYTGAGQFDSSTGTALLRPQGQLETAEQYSNLIVGGDATARRSICATSPRCRDSVQDERINMRFWVRGYRRAVGDRGRGGQPPGRRQRGRGRQEHPRAAAADQRRAAGLDPHHADLRPLAQHRSTRSPTFRTTLVIAFVLVVIVIFVFLGRATDTLIPAVALPLSLLLTFIAMRAAGLQPRQPFVDGADAGDRVPGRRRDRVSGKHRAPHGARRERVRGDASTAPKRSASRSCR